MAEFRKTLVEGVVPEGEVMEMTNKYLATLTSWSDMMKSASKGN